MRPNTRAVFAESLGNPSLVVLDIAAVADVAHAHGVPLVIDNTVPSPFLCNPLALGPTSWCTRPPSTWPATAPRWAG
jgi:O-acetylhomoserine (thiol)-lyase